MKNLAGLVLATSFTLVSAVALADEPATAPAHGGTVHAGAHAGHTGASAGATAGTHHAGASAGATAGTHHAEGHAHTHAADAGMAH